MKLCNILCNSLTISTGFQETFISLCIVRIFPSLFTFISLSDDVFPLDLIDVRQKKQKKKTRAFKIYTLWEK